MSTDSYFVDSNVWLYAFIDNSDPKHHVAATLLKQKAPFVISSQVVSEVCVNMLKKASRDESFVQRLISDFYSKYTVVSIDIGIQMNASQLREGYSLSYWDSMICAAALGGKCTKLFSEDMQDGLVIDDTLTIMNPFAES
jgi:predicted nucleic acid-binding protein